MSTTQPHGNNQLAEVTSTKQEVRALTDNGDHVLIPKGATVTILHGPTKSGNWYCSVHGHHVHIHSSCLVPPGTIQYVYAARAAVAVQDAVNYTGVAKSAFDSVITVRQFAGVNPDIVLCRPNLHPVAYLFAYQLMALAGAEPIDQFSKHNAAVRLCELIKNHNGRVHFDNNWAEVMHKYGLAAIYTRPNGDVIICDPADRAVFPGESENTDKEEPSTPCEPNPGTGTLQ